MALVIASVPEKISPADYARLVESVGLVVDDLLELTFHTRSIEAKVIARNASGSAYVVPDTNEIAVHTISIPVED